MDKEYKLVKNVSGNIMARKSFNELSVKTFDLSFEDWHTEGYWTEKYIPYVLLDNQEVVANISVNVMDTIWQNQTKRYLQLGTVMTAEQYRNKGLSRYLMEIVLAEWRSKCDAVYLFANDTVLDFYPKFGFHKEIEYQYSMPVTSRGNKGKIRKLNMRDESDRELLKSYYQKSNPFSAFPMINNYGLLMFYCSAFMKDSVYYHEDSDAVVIAVQEENSLICFDIYGDGNGTTVDNLSAFINESVSRVIFGFTPKDTTACDIKAVRGEDTLFVLNGKEDIFADNKLMFPVLSHA